MILTLDPICDAGAKYRTLDGTCNNLKVPKWGTAGTPLQRILPSAYADCKFRLVTTQVTNFLKFLSLVGYKIKLTTTVISTMMHRSYNSNPTMPSESPRQGTSDNKSGR